MFTTTLKAMVMAGSALAGCTALLAQETVVPEKANTAVIAAPTVETSPTVTEPVDPGGSQVRIVRLSQARGSVHMDRNTGRGYEAAFANVPVVSGAKLRTEQGIAEVEFEDNSSLRLTPGSEVVFTRLGRTAQGATETTVDVKAGLVYVTLEKTKASEFVLTDGAARVTLAPGAHVRLNALGSPAELAMLDGTGQLLVGSAETTLVKKQTVKLDAATQTVAAITKGTGELEWDTWDKQEKDYHNVKANSAFASGFGAYGANDLGYYGSFVDMPGCGTMWRPYFASAAWDPFANGVWTYYPSAGYSWVSPYPWGWLPYHSGMWSQCGGAGWGWRPGGSWYGLQNTAAMRLAKYPVRGPALPTGPARNAASLIPVNTKPLSVSGITGQSFAFRQDSAGLGVPRSGLGNLRSVSSAVQRNGMATTGMPETFAAPTNAHQTAAGINGVGGLRPTNGMSVPGRSSMGASAGSSSGGMRSSAGPSMSAPSAPSGGGAAAGGGHH